MVYLEYDAGMCRGNMAFNYSRHTNNKVCYNPFPH